MNKAGAVLILVEVAVLVLGVMLAWVLSVLGCDVGNPFAEDSVRWLSKEDVKEADIADCRMLHAGSVSLSEVCSLYGDVQNPVYLQKCLPDAKFVFTSLTDEPYFVHDAPDLIYLGGMPEQIQRRVIGKLMPYRERIRQIVEADVPILAICFLCRFSSAPYCTAEMKSHA